jgi:protease-4
VVFKDVIKQGRGLSQAEVDVLANGKIYTGPEALKLKLVDQIGGLEEAVAAAAAKAGASNPQVVRLKLQRSLFEGMGTFGTSSPNETFLQAQVGGASFKVSGAAAKQLFSPRPMYLFQGR